MPPRGLFGRALTAADYLNSPEAYPEVRASPMSAALPELALPTRPRNPLLAAPWERKRRDLRFVPDAPSGDFPAQRARQREVSAASETARTVLPPPDERLAQELNPARVRFALQGRASVSDLARGGELGPSDPFAPLRQPPMMDAPPPGADATAMFGEWGRLPKGRPPASAPEMDRPVYGQDDVDREWAAATQRARALLAQQRQDAPRSEPIESIARLLFGRRGPVSTRPRHSR